MRMLAPIVALSVLFLLLAFASPAHCQLVCATQISCTLTAPMTPALVTIAWDIETDPAVIGYRVLDGDTVILTVGNIGLTPVPLNSFGTHVLTVIAFAAPGGPPDSDKSSAITVLLQQTLPQKAPLTTPQNVRIAAAWQTCPTTSPYGTTGPVVTDFACHVFTLNAANQTLRDGVWVSAGMGTMYTFVPSGVYVLGTDGTWYLWSDGSSAWTPMGTTKPIS